MGDRTPPPVNSRRRRQILREKSDQQDCFGEPMTGEELVRNLEIKKEWFPTLKDDIEKACEILSADCWLRLKRSRRYWNKIVNGRI